MKLKEKVTKIKDGIYLLPKTGEMLVDVTAFLSEKLFSVSEVETWEQIARLASTPGVIGAYLMPDCHPGHGAPIGSVIVTEDTLIPACNGYDISCGILFMRVPGLTAGRVRNKYIRERLISEIEKRISTGSGNSSFKPVLSSSFTEEQVNQILLYGIQVLNSDISCYETAGFKVPEDLDLKRIDVAYKKVIPQLGSVGGGNHFIEIQCEPNSGEVWLMIHSGSRGYGHQIADYFFDQAAHVRKLNRKYRETAYLRIDEPTGLDYWNYAGTAANFASANRQIIANHLNDALEEIFQVRGEIYYEISHNLIQRETLVLPDGTTKTGFIHRKGATRALPASHPDLTNTIWQDTGHPCLIPGSMYHGAAILFANPLAYQSACSVSHGSGRSLTRSEAKRKLDHKQQRINDEMKHVVREFGGVKIEGIVSNCKNIPLDECGHAYKDLDEILNVLVTTGIADIKYRLYPIANVKGKD